MLLENLYEMHMDFHSKLGVANQDIHNIFTFAEKEVMEGILISLEQFFGMNIYFVIFARTTGFKFYCTGYSKEEYHVQK